MEDPTIYDDFMEDATTEPIEPPEPESTESDPEPTEPKEQEVISLITEPLEMFEFIHDKKTGNVTMSKETFKKMMDKLFI